MPVLAEVNNGLGPRRGRDSFVCDNVRRLLTFHAGVMAGEINIEVVEVDIANTDSG